MNINFKPPFANECAIFWMKWEDGFVLWNSMKLETFHWGKWYIYIYYISVIYKYITSKLNKIRIIYEKQTDI